MYAEKVARSSTATFVPPVHGGLAARLQGKEATHKVGNLSPLLGRQWSGRSGLQGKRQQMQAKEQPVSPAEAFKGGGSSLPAALMAKYEKLAGGDVNLGDVKVHTGSNVDSVLASNGLDGVTDRQNVAVRSGAAPKTFEHEIGHVLQGRLLKNFNLNEQTRGGYEKQADDFADKLASNQPIVTTSASSSVSSHDQSRDTDGGLQAKCSECSKKEKRLQLREQPAEGQKKEQPAEGQSKWLSELWEQMFGKPSANLKPSEMTATIRKKIEDAKKVVNDTVATIEAESVRRAAQKIEEDPGYWDIVWSKLGSVFDHPLYKLLIGLGTGVGFSCAGLMLSTLAPIIQTFGGVCLGLLGIAVIFGHIGMFFGAMAAAGLSLERK
ncbi:MAG: DUF4157 domain-containing protein [Cyanophyceae cyanobacterium]